MIKTKLSILVYVLFGKFYIACDNTDLMSTIRKRTALGGLALSCPTYQAMLKKIIFLCKFTSFGLIKQKKEEKKFWLIIFA